MTVTFHFSRFFISVPSFLPSFFSFLPRLYSCFFQHDNLHPYFSFVHHSFTLFPQSYYIFLPSFLSVPLPFLRLILSSPLFYTIKHCLISILIFFSMPSLFSSFLLYFLLLSFSFYRLHLLVFLNSFPYLYYSLAIFNRNNLILNCLFFSYQTISSHFIYSSIILSYVLSSPHILSALSSFIKFHVVYDYFKYSLFVVSISFISISFQSFQIQFFFFCVSPSHL